MRSFTLAFGLFVLFQSILAHAEGSTASAGSLGGSSSEATSESSGGEEVVPQSSESAKGFQKKFEENHEISDASLKANAGSLSRWSMRFNLGYAGPPLGDLSALEQPNLDGTVTNDATSVSGNMGVRYRFDPARSLSLVVGVQDDYPLREQQHFGLSNPTMAYNSGFRFLGWQMLSSPGFSLITDRVLHAKGEYGSVVYTLNSVRDLGDSDFALSFDSSVNWYLFYRDYNAAPVKKGGDGKLRRIKYTLQPGAKYNVTRKFNVNAYFGINLFNPRNEESSLPIYSRPVYIRTGVGYAFTRDIYVNPYLQLYPGHLGMNTTTINLSTVFSIL
jgi:hypothetical protein